MGYPYPLSWQRYYQAAACPEMMQLQSARFKTYKLFIFKWWHWIFSNYLGMIWIEYAPIAALIKVLNHPWSTHSRYQYFNNPKWHHAKLMMINLCIVEQLNSFAIKQLCFKHTTRTARYYGYHFELSHDIDGSILYH